MTAGAGGNRCRPPEPVRTPFAIEVPADWLRVDLDSGRAPDRVAAALRRAEGTEPAMRRHRGLIEREVRSVVRAARQQDLSFCAVLATVVDDVLPLVAALTVAIRPLPDRWSRSVLMARAGRSHIATPQRFGGDGDNLGDEADLGGGAARAWQSTDGLRLHFVQSVNGVPSRSSAVPSGAVHASVCQYFIPSPVDRDLAVITGSTPMLSLAAEFAAVFDGIAATFRRVPRKSREPTARLSRPSRPG